MKPTSLAAIVLMVLFGAVNPCAAEPAADRPATTISATTTAGSGTTRPVDPGSAAAGSAASIGPTIKSLRAGFAGQYKQGVWAPWNVTIVGGSEPAIVHLAIEVADGDGIETVVRPPGDPALQLAAGQESVVTVYAKAGLQGAPCKVRLTVEHAPGTVVREFGAGDKDGPADALGATQSVIVSLGGAPDVEAQRADVRSPHQYLPSLAQLDSVEQLATQWYGYAGVNAIVVFTSDPQSLKALTPDSLRWRALDAWVRQGGTLVLCAASAADELCAPGAPLAGFVPGRIQGGVTLRQTTAWENYAETGEPLPPVAGLNGQAGRLTAPRLFDVAGTIEAYEGARPSDLPLIVRAPRGFGEIVFVAADLDQAPFAGWAGTSKLWDKILVREQAIVDDGQAAGQGQVTWYGYSDLGGQLHASLEQFAGVNVPFALVVSLILLYIACIGPVDYFLLKRFARRMEWTWITFPAIAIAFGVFAYVLAHRLKGQQTRVNQVDLVDVDVSTGLVRGTMWSMLFSPDAELYNLSLATNLPQKEPRGTRGGEPHAAASGSSAPTGEVIASTGERTAPGGGLVQPIDSLYEPVRADVLFSWLGLPGSGYGGMARRSSAEGLFQDAYSFGPELATLKGLPISVWSTKGLTARWTARVDKLLTADLQDPGDQVLTGMIENHSELSLRDAVLVYDRWAYPLGAVVPHGTITFNGRLDQQNVDTFFKHPALNEGRDTLQPYDTAALDVNRIMEAIMFYEAAGGMRYTRLSNGFQDYLDAARQLRCGRAVLMGHAPAGATRILRDGQPLVGDADQHWTFVRFMLPVEKTRK